ncbi:MAG TPA: recombination mediator RecR [Gemmatales bacterium]|nr:recombination mediator RecR [Gemmatales bacterium]HMP57984.1 recombination mediator RecR [Gemmatales bacterium]
MAVGEPRGPLASLIEEFCRLPGIGPKSAERLAHHLLAADPAQISDLIAALSRVRDGVHPCRTCFNPTEGDQCDICLDPRRDPQVICVVEQPKDLMALERAAVFKGQYHILQGRIAPLENVGPEKLTVDQLLRRIEENQVRELIMATNPTIEGDGTALYISNLLASTPVKITRLARGLAAGSHLEFANRDALADALEGRRTF